MKSFYLLALAAALAFTGCKKDDSAPVQIVTSDFDPVFAQVLQQRGYIPDANNITTADLAAITELDVWGGEGDSPGPLTSLRGIEHFTSLTTLSCDYNELTELEVSANTKLTDLWCNNNQLTKLDVSDNTKLETLWCFSNQLESLDLSANTKLETLSCNNNPGDGESKFPITAWFDNQSIPDALLYQSSWEYDGKTITIDFRKAE